MRSFWLRLVVLALPACSASPLRTFPRSPVRVVDPDRSDVVVACHEDIRDGKKTRVCAPEPRSVPGGWDIADSSLYSPMSRGLGIELAKPSINVNALDEVPDSSWFENRVSLAEEDVLRGACPAVTSPSPSPDLRLNVDDVGLETNRPVFKLREPIDVILKGDIGPDNERATAAAVIASRLAWAAGYNVPCDEIVYLARASLVLKAGLMYPDLQLSRMLPLTDARFDAIVHALPQAQGRVRLHWSNPVPGYAIGPWRFEGVRRDDPNDVIPHENRREVRASRILAAWLGHYEVRAKNTMASFISATPERIGSSPGAVRHFFFDFSDAFGAPSEPDAAQRRMGHSYGFDLEHVGADFVTLGLLSRPWYAARPSPFPKVFGYFGSALFDPVGWKPTYPNPAYSFMQDEDAAWMARVLARLTPNLVRAAVRAGRLSHPEQEQYLVTELLARRAIILRRYFELRSPLTGVAATGRRVCVQDLGRTTGAFDKAGYACQLYAGKDAKDAGSLLPKVDGTTICIDVPAAASGELDGVPEADLRRYRILDVATSASKGVLRIHLYDLGPKQGLEIAGLERPADRRPPR